MTHASRKVRPAALLSVLLPTALVACGGSDDAMPRSIC
jgi:hypothetical protein